MPRGRPKGSFSKNHPKKFHEAIEDAPRLICKSCGLRLPCPVIDNDEYVRLSKYPICCDVEMTWSPQTGKLHDYDQQRSNSSHYGTISIEA